MPNVDLLIKVLYCFMCVYNTVVLHGIYGNNFADLWYVQNVSTFPNTFAIISPLICVFWIQLTRTDAIFSRIVLVSRFYAEIQLSVKIRDKSSKILFHQKTHGARRRDRGEAQGPHTHRGRGLALVAPTWCEDASAIPSTSPFAYIYPLTWLYRGDSVFPK
jgi:hypothetical protein